MKDGWFKMFGAADEAFIRFLAKYLKDRVTGRFHVRFSDGRSVQTRPRPEDRGRIEFLTASGQPVAAVAGIRYRHFQQVIEIMEYRPLSDDGRNYTSSP